MHRTDNGIGYDFVTKIFISKENLAIALTPKNLRCYANTTSPFAQVKISASIYLFKFGNTDQFEGSPGILSLCNQRLLMWTAPTLITFTFPKGLRIDF